MNGSLYPFFALFMGFFVMGAIATAIALLMAIAAGIGSIAARARAELSRS